MLPELDCKRAVEEQMLLGLDCAAPNTNAETNAGVGRLQEPEPRADRKKTEGESKLQVRNHGKQDHPHMLVVLHISLDLVHTNPLGVGSHRMWFVWQLWRPHETK